MRIKGRRGNQITSKEGGKGRDKAREERREGFKKQGRKGGRERRWREES